MANDEEARRLRALRDFDIIDTTPESAFDDIALMAARIAGTPMAVVSFLDGRRQWFKATYGLALRDTDRQISFCDFTIRGCDSFVVEDARTDPRFDANPLVTAEPFVRFYAGVPLLTSAKAALGSIAVLDRVPRKLTAEQFDSLHMLARMAMMQLELRQRRHGARQADVWQETPAQDQSALDLEAGQRAEAALLDLAERFRAVARATVDIVWDWNIGGSMVWWNDGMMTLFGWHESEIGTDPEIWIRLIHPDDRRRVLASINDAVDGSGELWQCAYRLGRKDGSYAQVLDQGFIIRDGEGRALRMVGAIRDQTESVTYQQKLSEQAALLDKARDAIVVHGLDHRIRFWNEGAARLYGWTREEAEGRSIQELLYHDETNFVGAMAHVLAAEEWSGDIRQFRRDGTALTVAAHWNLVRDDTGEPLSILSINTDISKRIAVEEQLRQAQKLEAIGQLTGGIAHDFNNLLTVILGNAELLMELLAADARALPFAKMTKAAAERGAELTRRLLAFARRQPLAPDVIDVNRLLGRIDTLLRRALGGNIEVEIIRGAGLWGALVDPGQLESALLNLCINARDAMPNGGRLTIETGNAWLDENYAIQHQEVVAGPYVLLTVTDTGTGVPPEFIDRIFEPFFSTKDAGKGSGLGLSMVYGFVKQSGGHVKLYSEPDQGTAVRIYLPRSEGPAVEPDKAADRDTRGGTEHILLVEDDDMVRQHVGEMLQRLGYRVTSAADGQAALAALRTLQSRPGDAVDLLFTDIVMPGEVDGRRLANAARQQWPHLRVLFTSGFSANAIVHQGRLDADVQLLSKPYSRQRLAQKLRQVLSAPLPDPPSAG